jgi:hypothetical protein
MINANDNQVNSMFVFLHIPKTAGSTFQFILENNFGVSACHTNHIKKKVFSRDDFAFAKKLFPRMKSLAGHNLVDPLALDVPGAFHLTFLREPVARVFSHYHESMRTSGNTLSLEESLEKKDYLNNLHVKLMAGELNLDKAKKYLERCSFVGLTEKFELSLHILKRLSPWRLNLNYKRRRTAPNDRAKKSPADDPRSAEIVREYNHLDMALYNFALQEIFPKFCAQTGFRPDDQVASYDNYTSDIHWRYRLCHIYNLLAYRQLVKFRH